MLKSLLVLVVLVAGMATLSGCHAGVRGEKGHGADVNVG
jgi:predicted small secreted protein